MLKGLPEAWQAALNSVLKGGGLSSVSMMFSWNGKGFLRSILLYGSQATLCLSRTLYKPH